VYPNRENKVDLSSLTSGQLIDRMEAITKRKPLTYGDRAEYDTLTAEADRRDAEWRSAPMEHRGASRATEADVAEIAGYPGGSVQRGSTSEERAFTSYLRDGRVAPELRAAGEATGTAGGFMVPQSFWAHLQIAQKQFGGLSEDFQQIHTPDGRVMPWPTNNPTTTLASYLTENTAVSDVNYVFGQGMLFSWTLVSGAILASLQQIGRKLAAEVVNGAGPASEALSGIVPALTAYGATSSNASGGVLALGTATTVKMFSGSTTELSANVLAPATAFSMIAAVDPAYWPGAKFYMNAAQALNMRQVVDDNGRPLLNLDNGFQDGCIGSIAGFPVKVVQEVGNLTASTVEGPMFGNMGAAMVLRTVEGAQLMRLTERWADYLQVGFIGYSRFDSQPNDMRAACVVKSSTT
jgi:predicted phage gp36 major capsid-like protein